MNIFNSSIFSLFKEQEHYNKAFVYIADMREYANNLLYFWKCLSESEQAQARRYHNKLLTNNYIISHGILRCILSYYTKQPLENIKFNTNEYGKPYLEGSNIKFNMSHSRNIVCYAVTINNNVGIDVEFNDNNLDVLELSKLVLTPNEVIIFESLHPKEQYKTFYNLWTKKEALIKAIGLGLSYPISTIEALPLGQSDKVTLNNTRSQTIQELYTYLLQIAPNYSGYIATEEKISEIVYIRNIEAIY